MGAVGCQEDEEIDIFIMGEIRIYSSIWRRELFIGVLCVAVAAMLIIKFVVWDATKLVVVLFLGLMGLYLLFDVFCERLMRRPYLTITDESIIINRKYRKEVAILFDEIKSFERETLTIWKYTNYTGMIIVHMKNGHSFVHVISANGLAIKEQLLWDLLNKRLKRK